MKRLQLTLFVPESISGMIESVRRVVDPVQHRLIPAHVTLCREDELETFAGWRERLESLKPGEIALCLRFGRAEPSSGHGLLLPCIEGIDRFRKLRRSILGSDAIRDSQPHLTLAHPRNPKSAANSIELTLQLPETFEIEFPAIRLIEQVDSSPWRTIEVFPSP